MIDSSNELFNILWLFWMHGDWDWQYSSLTGPILVDDQLVEAKAEQATPPVKKEPPIVAETKVLDGAAPVAPSGKKKNSAKKQKTEPGIDYFFNI